MKKTILLTCHKNLRVSIDTKLAILIVFNQWNENWEKTQTFVGESSGESSDESSDEPSVSSSHLKSSSRTSSSLISKHSFNLCFDVSLLWRQMFWKLLSDSRLLSHEEQIPSGSQSPFFTCKWESDFKVTDVMITRWGWKCNGHRRESDSRSKCARPVDDSRLRHRSRRMTPLEQDEDKVCTPSLSFTLMFDYEFPPFLFTALALN